MGDPRSSPYIYVTWLTKLLAGEEQCQWKSWFKAHYRWEKPLSDFDLAQWTANHTQMLQARAAVMRKEGYAVYIEGQNDFRLQGKSGATLAGKPDIVGVKNGRCLVVDCKTGQERHSDKIQVLIYMLLLTQTHTACNGLPIDGEVQYSTGSVSVRAEDLTDQFRTQFRELMHKLGEPTPLVRVPSQSECRFCDITINDCPDRLDESAQTFKTDIF